MFNLIRPVLNALKPHGALWEPEPDEGLDNQWAGITDALDTEGRALADTLADIRNPRKTSVFTDLERNYGIQPNENILLDTRIARLEQKVYQGSKVNSIDDLQAELIRAGFDLQVHKNDPPVDPAIFLDQSFQMTAGSDFAYAGYNDGVNILAFAGTLGGEMLVNTPIFTQTPAVEMQAGGAFGYAGFTSDGIDFESTAGYFNALERIDLEYPIPTDLIYWPLVFFVGGDATRDPVTDELTSIQSGFVDSNRRDELKALILSDKNAGTWCGLIIIFT